MNNPLVSVIIPVYNVEKYLKECLDSVVNQSLKNIEIIIVNDCSPDNSEKIILDYMSKDARIVYIKHEANKKLGGARNTGLRAAKGDWVYFLDSDDYIALDILQKTVEKCLSTGAGLGVFGRKEFGVFREKKTFSLYLPPKEFDGKILDEKIMGKIYTSTCYKLYRKSDLINNNIFFPENVFIEDWPFYYYYTALVHPKIAVVREYGYFYRRNEESIMGQIGRNGVYAPIVASSIVEFLRKNDLWDSYKFPFFDDLPFYISRVPLMMEETNFKDFLDQFIIFCKTVSPSPEDLEKFPAFCFAYLDTMPRSQQAALLRALSKIQANKWYRFGQQNGFKNKLKMALNFLRRKLGI